MILDTIFILLIIMATWSGLNKGLIVAVCSIATLIIGLAAATKLSATVATHLESSANIGSRWLPFISFIIVMIGISILVKLLAGVLSKVADVMMMGWANKLAGALLYIAMYTIVFSVIMFYMVSLNLISKETIQSSSTYPYIEPWGKILINGLGEIIPAMKNIYSQLQSFFETFSKKN